MSDHVHGLVPALALGLLGEDERVATLAHLLDCDACAADLDEARETLNELSTSLAIGTPPPSGRAALLDALTPGLPAVRRHAGMRRRFETLFALAPGGFDRVVATLDDPRSWETPMAGVRLTHFTPGALHAGADAGFVHFRAGDRFPLHEHVGDEYMLVFEGALREDTTGVEAHPGDVLLRRGGTSHSFTLLPGDDCLAAVLLLGGPPRFPGGEMKLLEAVSGQPSADSQSESGRFTAVLGLKAAG